MEVLRKKSHPSKEEATQLNIRRLAGDEEAREEMIIRNIPLVYKLVGIHNSRYAGILQ